MLFSSNVFLFAFLPTVLAVYYLVPRVLRNPVLLLVSLVFYGWGEPVYLLLMLAAILLNYGFGLWIWAIRRKGKGAKAVLAAGVAANLLLLGYFKYASFLMSAISTVIPGLQRISVPQVELPIGISFYIFQSMSYIIDIYRDDAPVQKNPLTFGTYVALFPQLIAGPIVRYQDVAQQLSSRRENLNDFSSGVLLFIVGLSKKVLLANPMGEAWLQLQYETGLAAAWIGLAAYTLQIYFDFSGYSDMARGLGRMFGFEFLENFRYPYISVSVTEFWRRWHISLSTWFREYVYIPLGGNRRGKGRQLLNLLIVWFLTGLWHGASWNFALWGLYYAVLLILEKLFLLRVLEKLPKPAKHLYTLLVVMIGWALFYFEDLGALGEFMGRLWIPVPASSGSLPLIASFLPLMAVAAFAATPIPASLAVKRDTPALRFVKAAAAACALLLCVGALASQSYNPFIYFRF